MARSTERRLTAHHEAGHIVVAHALGWSVEFAEICDDNTGQTRSTRTPKQDRITTREQHIAQDLAGYAAELRVLPETNERKRMNFRALHAAWAWDAHCDGKGDDDLTMARRLSKDVRVLGQVWRKTIAYVARPDVAEKINVVAELLVRRGRIGQVAISRALRGRRLPRPLSAVKRSR